MASRRMTLSCERCKVISREAVAGATVVNQVAKEEQEAAISKWDKSVRDQTWLYKPNYQRILISAHGLSRSQRQLRAMKNRKVPLLKTQSKKRRMRMELMASLTTFRKSHSQLVVAAVVSNANGQIRRTQTRLERRVRRISDIRIMADEEEEVVVDVAVAVVATSIEEDTVRTEKEMVDISLTVEEEEVATTVVVNIVEEIIEATTITEAIEDGGTIIDQQVIP